MGCVGLGYENWTHGHVCKDKDKDLSLKDEDKDKDLKIGPRGSSRTRTFLEDNNTAQIIKNLTI